MSYKPESNMKRRNQQSWPNQDGYKISSGVENFMPVAKGKPIQGEENKESLL